MAKYDDFGRPIYETAEEYNKAHKGGVCPRTYDSSEGDVYQHTKMRDTFQNQSATQRYEIRTGSKKAKTLVIGVISFIIAINLIIIFWIFNMVDNSYLEYEEEWAEMDDSEGYGEYIGDADTPLPEGFEKFYYEGYPCTLPTEFEDIALMGFTIMDYDMIGEFFPADYEEILDINDEMGFNKGMIRINNHTNETLVIGDCMVDYFYIYNPALYDETETTPDFEFGDGLTFESSYDDVEAYFGIPYYYYEEESKYGNYHESYEWAYYGEDEIHYVTVTFWNDEMSSVSIEKKAYEEKY